MNFDGDDFRFVLLWNEANVGDFLLSISGIAFLISNLLIHGVVNVFHVGHQSVVDHCGSIFRQLYDRCVLMAICVWGLRETWRNLRHFDWQWLVFSSVSKSESAIHSIAWARRLFPNDTQPLRRFSPARTLISRDAAGTWVVSAWLAREEIKSDARSYTQLEYRWVFHDWNSFAESNVTEIDAIAGEQLIARSKAWFSRDTVFLGELNKDARLPVGALTNSSIKKESGNSLIGKNACRRRLPASEFGTRRHIQHDSNVFGCYIIVTEDHWRIQWYNMPSQWIRWFSARKRKALTGKWKSNKWVLQPIPIHCVSCVLMLMTPVAQQWMNRLNESWSIFKHQSSPQKN